MDLGRCYHYDDLVDAAIGLQKKYPSWIQCEALGVSCDNREIILVKVGRGEKNIIMTGGVHGRETVNPAVLMAMAEEYCMQYPEMLEEYSLYMVPLLNPDGYMIALRGFNVIQSERLRLGIKSRGIPYYLWKYNARAIDLNRNFPSETWVKKNFKDEAASESETRALIKLFDGIESIGYLDYHSRGKLIFYYRSAMPLEYNENQYRLASSLCMMTDYALVPRQEEIEPGDSGGNTVHYYSEKIKMPAFTVETVDELATFPLKLSYQKETFEEILKTPFVFLKDLRLLQ